MLQLVWIYYLMVLPARWSELESSLPEAQQAPAVYDKNEWNDDNDARPAGKPILFRDREGLSPTAQQLWLALEIKQADYITVLTDRFEETKVLWPDGTTQTDPIAILERINNEYSVNGYNTQDLFQRVSKAVDNVRCNIARLDPIFPRNTDAYLEAPYLFRNGELTSRDSHTVSLEEIDEVLEEYEDGPFFCGDFVSAADCYWAPYLERYAAQLPLTQDGDMLEPRYGGRYDAITEWFDAMEAIPCYACRVGGDAVSWENVLKEAVAQGNVPNNVNVELLPSRGKRVPKHRQGAAAQKIWDKYRQTRPYLCKTPQEECVAYIVRNRQQIVEKLLASSGDELRTMTQVEIDNALRETISALLGKIDTSKLSGNARDVAAVLDTQLRAPRDMGMLAIAPLRALVTAAPKPRIKAN